MAVSGKKGGAFGARDGVARAEYPPGFGGGYAFAWGQMRVQWE